MIRTLRFPRGVTLGRSISGPTALAELTLRTKLSCVVLVAVEAAALGPAGRAALAALLLAAWVTLSEPLGARARRLWLPVSLGGVSAGATWLGALSTDGFVPEAGAGALVARGAQVTLVALAAALFSATTAPAAIARSALRIGCRWSVLREVGAVLGLAVVAVPRTAQIAARLRRAQEARGLGVGQGLGGRIRDVIGLLVPLVRLAAYKADRMADALNARVGALEALSGASPSATARDLVAVVLIALPVGFDAAFTWG